MIPKVIHYCWFGGKPLPHEAERCIRSWKKYCPGYQIREWNETSFDVNCHPYIREALEHKKYAFATDLVRLIVLYNEGGIYMDTDVELIESVDDLLEDRGYMGFEAEARDGRYLINTGLGMAAEPGHKLIGAMLHDYDGVCFIKPDGTPDMTACPERNSRVLAQYGLKLDNTAQTIEGIHFLPSDWLCPIRYTTGETGMTRNTRSIHHYAMSWMDAKSRRFFRYQHLVHRMKQNSFGRVLIRLKKKILPKSVV